MSAPFTYQFTRPGSAGPGGTSGGLSGNQASGSAGPADYQAAETNDANALQWLMAWGLVLLLALLLNRARWGHALTYYGLSLSLLLLVLVNHQAIAALLAPAGDNSQATAGAASGVEGGGGG